MHPDIGPILRAWPYEEEAFVLRVIAAADDGRPLLQIRLDLGLLQLEWEGRPDGERPHGYPSLLDYYRARADAYRERHGWYEGFTLSPADCAELRRESLQYYHRRVCFLNLQEFGRAIADADHNLAILDLLKAFAARREDWLSSEQYRAFILSHRLQAEALLCLQQGAPREALIVLDRGIRALRALYAEQGALDEFDESVEATSLDDLRRRIVAQYGISHRERLEILLDDALRREDPEAAAELRAQLRELDAGDFA